MSVLNGQQFLPGMNSMKTASPKAATTPRPPATTGQWSGQIPGQMVMGVHDASHGIPTSHGDFSPHVPYEIDPHGNVDESVGPHRGRIHSSADKAAGNPSSRQLYKAYGGGNAKNEEVKAHWASQPIVQIRSDTPLHTGQSATTTETKAEMEKPTGRTRINKIRESLRAGDPIREPAWVVKQSGRLYAMDGHHRIVAAREEGLSHYPARVWDRDKS